MGVSTRHNASLQYHVKIRSFEDVILMLSFTMETVEVNAMVDMPTSINLDKFWVVLCVFDGDKHPSHLHRRKSSDMNIIHFTKK